MLGRRGEVRHTLTDGLSVLGELDGDWTEAGEWLCKRAQGDVGRNVEDDEQGTRKFRGQVLEDLLQRVHAAGGRTDHYVARPRQVLQRRLGRHSPPTVGSRDTNSTPNRSARISLMDLSTGLL